MNYFRQNKVLTGFCIGFAIVFSVGWSIQESSLNLWPCVIAIGFFLSVRFLDYIFRNKP